MYSGRSHTSFTNTFTIKQGCNLSTIHETSSIGANPNPTGLAQILKYDLSMCKCSLLHDLLYILLTVWPIYFSYTCSYLACKVEEFNVSIKQFVDNIEGADLDEYCNLILSLELLLMQQLHYHLTVHNPFRPLEGLLIDIKVV